MAHLYLAKWHFQIESVQCRSLFDVFLFMFVFFPLVSFKKSTIRKGAVKYPIRLEERNIL